MQKRRIERELKFTIERDSAIMGYGVMVDVTLATRDFATDRTVVQSEGIDTNIETVPSLRKWHTIYGIWR
jgi:hypothetical protein